MTEKYLKIPDPLFAELTESTGLAVSYWEGLDGYILYAFDSNIGFPLMKGNCFDNELPCLACVYEAIARCHDSELGLDHFLE